MFSVRGWQDGYARFQGWDPSVPAAVKGYKQLHYWCKKTTIPFCASPHITWGVAEKRRPALLAKKKKAVTTFDNYQNFKRVNQSSA